MTPREIVAEAWTIATRERQLWWWGFMASLFQTLLNIKLLGYQAYFVYAYWNKIDAGLLDDFIWLYRVTSLNVTVGVAALFGVLLCIEFFMPHLTEGAIIGLSAKSYEKQEMKGGIVLSIYNFFPLFALHELFVLSGWATALTAASLSMRYLPSGFGLPAIIIVVGIWTATNFLKFFASFAQQGIVLRKYGVFESIGKSYKLFLSNVGHIMFLFILLLVISLRVIINTIMIFLIPGIAIGIALLLTFIFSPFTSYLVATVLGILLIVLVSYFLAYIHVFKQTVWTLTFIQLEKRREIDDFS